MNLRIPACKPVPPVRLAALVLACFLGTGLAAVPSPSAAQAAPRPGASTAEPAAPVRKDKATGASSAVVVSRVKAFRVTGSRVISAEKLEDELRPWLGRDLTMGDLDAVVEYLAAYYRDQGYFLTYVYLPEQTKTLEQGVLQVAVIEARVEKLEVQNQARIPKALVLWTAGAISNPGMTPKTWQMERASLLLNSTPGVKRAEINAAAGVNQGGVALTALVERGDWYNGNVNVTNYGDSRAGTYQIGSSIAFNSPGGFGDQLALTAQVSDTLYSKVYGGSYSVPLFFWGTRLGAAYNASYYKVGGTEFNDLGINNNSTTSSAFLMFPLWRTRTTAITSTLTQESADISTTTEGSVQSTDKRTISRTRLSNTFLWRSAGGTAVELQLGMTQGKLKINETSNTSAGDTVKDGTSFTIIPYQVSTLMPLSFISENWYGYLGVRGQSADTNLPSTEKYSLGGPTAVRGYPNGEVRGDDATVGTLEMRYIAALPRNWGNTVTSLFFDTGTANIYHQAPDSASASVNSQTRSGFGLGFSWNAPKDILVSLDIAARSGSAATSDTDSKWRLWFKVSKDF